MIRTFGLIKLIVIMQEKQLNHLELLLIKIPLPQLKLEIILNIHLKLKMEKEILSMLLLDFPMEFLPTEILVKSVENSLNQEFIL